ncbi:hypothetical protein RD792_005598 [Penstemon davidsonii]|uniref:Beta-glucosidase n=1 Tax=Penstemon davidsonii TaxID=160366 RepID=A0ABR0DES3_9LAMI|nr:hypothetical protein RD792_005598 [Penstemon davidsonii]
MSKMLGPQSTEIIGEVRREHFGRDFVFGSATAAFQTKYWMAAMEMLPLTTINSIRHDDVKLMKNIGLEAYRFSISWPRILPGGRINAGINSEGIKFYSDLIDLLLAQGIEPYVTLFHWDLPLALELEYGGFLSDKIVKDFTEFAELCFWEFGDRVKNWITFNEGWTYCKFGYVVGTFPPGHGMSSVEQRNSKYRCCNHKGAWIQRIFSEIDEVKEPYQAAHNKFRAHANSVEAGIQRVCSEIDAFAEPYLKAHNLFLSNTDAVDVCSKGDPGTEPYKAAHNMLLAHAHAVDVYRKLFQKNQGGKIGMTNNCHYFEPLNDTDEDKAACIRALDWMLGWFVAPITTGDYPPNMRKSVKERLPKFSPDETKLIKGSYDFIGLNYYTTWYATNAPRQPGEKPTYLSDQELTTQTEKNKVPIGEPTGATWLFIVPRGIYNLLVYVKETYNTDLIYITENGMAEVNNPNLTISKATMDPQRVRYYNQHLWYLRKAIMEADVNVKAYFLWSFADNFEWAEGYTSRFGIFYIDFKDGRYTRVPKTSAIWWKNFFTKKSISGYLKREAKDIGHRCDLEKKPKGYGSDLEKKPKVMNGMAEVNNPNLTISKVRMDPLRVRYYNEHLWYLRKAIMEADVNVMAYFLWSFADNFEWVEGYTSRFGIFYIDFKDGRYTRVPKTSAIWWKNFFTKKSIRGSLKREATEIGHGCDL